MSSVIQNKPQGDIALVLTFSGGGTRAAALAYGVLQELNETTIRLQHKNLSLLDEVDIISSVSGGSFIAAYYGLKGKRTFDDFEKVMLKQDIEYQLISGLLNPFQWFGSTGRTEMAVQLYNQSIFKGATFSDLNKPNRPLILINATDLSNGVRFSFTQDYFDLICSNINDFPLAKAVTASSAVPVVFNPVVLKNYYPCNNNVNQRLKKLANISKTNYELQQTISGLKSYTNTVYPYLHLVDGGISDNLGLRAIYEAIELSGGANAFMKKVGKHNVKHIAVIAVDASTQSTKSIRLTNESPSIQQSMDAVTDIQIHRYNIATLQLFEKSLEKWGKELSTATQKVVPHFIKLNFDQLPSNEERAEFNLIPTSLTLTEPEITKLIKAGRSLLKNNLQFQLLLQVLDNDQTANKAQ
ncbi:patatin-like phospholipase family protein [Thiomicrorhabdus sp. Milos-T2]|uniref:patatin-like phospholipase family protein n=1 Tax=Thiomicrorhabdus sp. Milos-T2 TaxID=90814 RepID=UPI000689C9DA|nr:patatin-like phospholipase family protein [Thiomicrorhabdus sp. Milos-T2]